jgi:hypothetical protein
VVLAILAAHDLAAGCGLPNADADVSRASSSARWPK